VFQPSVSVGNAGQLAVDLLITKVKPRKVGLIWHSAIMPMVGGDPYSFGETALTTSAECKGHKLEQCIVV
jgi:proteasome assembly chaperone 2